MLPIDARPGHSLFSCFSLRKNVRLELIRLQIRTPVSSVLGRLLTVTSRSKRFVRLRAMGCLPESDAVLLNSDVKPLNSDAVKRSCKYPKVDRDETRVDIIHGRKVPDPYRG